MMTARSSELGRNSVIQGQYTNRRTEKTGNNRIDSPGSEKRSDRWEESESSETEETGSDLDDGHDFVS